MDATTKLMIQLAHEFSSNEDEVGIFMQGYTMGAIAMVNDKATIEDLEADRKIDLEKDAASLAKLCMLFLQSKREIEIRQVRMPSFLHAMRNSLLSAADKIARANI